MRDFKNIILLVSLFLECTSYTDDSSISVRFNPHLRWSDEMELLDVTSPALTGSDVSHVTGNMFCAWVTGSRAFFLL
jgi:hypothetical protein